MNNILKLSLILSAIDKMSPVVDKAIVKAQAKFKALGDSAFDIGRSGLMMGATMGAALAAPIKSAVEFESGMTDVRKVVDGLRDETAFKEFSQEVLKLGRELPIAYDELTAMVAASGRMGIAKEDLIAYTREVGKMAMAFDMNAAEAGKSMGKIANIFNIPKKEIGKLADALNTLDDAMTLEGKDLMDIMTRAGGTANLLKMPATQLASLGAAFLELADTPEIASTAINAFFAKLGAASLGDKKFQSALQMLGMDARQIEKDMASGKAQDVINKIMAGIRDKIKPEDQIKVASMLFGLEHFDSATKLASGLDVYKKGMSTLTDRGADGKLKYEGSMQREYEARMKTTAAQMKLFKNNLAELAINIGTALLPAVNSVLQSIKPMVDAVRDWAARNPELVATIGKVVAVLGATTVAVSGLSFVFGGMFRIIGGGIKMFQLLRSGAGMLGTGFKLVSKIGGLFTGVLGGVVKGIGFVGTAIRAVTAIMMANPIGLAVAAIAGAVYLIYKYWGNIKGFFSNLWEGTKSVFSSFTGWVGDWAGWLWEKGKGAMHGLWEGMKGVASSIGDWFASWWESDIEKIASRINYSGTFGDAMQAMTTGITTGVLPTNAPRTGGGLAGFAAATMSRGGLPTPIAANNNTTNQSINFSPTINITGTGTTGDITAAMERAKEELGKQLRAQEDRKTRKTYQ